jgi:ParB-like chromosome segregation protein Spo0J
MTHPTKSIPLSQLHFDLENPRYGNWGTDVKSDSDALEMIVTEFSVDDLLSSISVNGFFDGEPLIVREKEPSNYTVVEGNRRLASSLILSSDSRAASQQKRTTIYQARLAEHQHACPSSVPAIVLQGDDS